ncbi:MAG: 2-oxo acid dehydrogenase subunit E2 [Gemmataceae bacterium]|nr:2-oxo acid dehydrogenase subunit E2 [Gemmataceae bacterium]MDW8243910.1 dihydrolipoamide acetyltransferase family protein [Thermogemmata sp.]
MTDFALPPVGEGLIEVELLRWLVQPGETVRPGQGLAEVMSDKATMEVPAPFSGRIVALHATPGRKVRVGEPLLSYEPAEGTVASDAPPLVTPAMSETRLVQSATPAQGAPAEVSVAAPNASRPANTEVSGKQGNGQSTAAVRVLPHTLPPAAPSVRLLARRLGLDLTRIRGSGPGGRILLDDLAPFLRLPGTAAQGSEPPPSPPDTPAFDLGKPGTRFALTGLRRRIAEHLVAAKRFIPHYSYIDECDVSELVRLREQLREAAAQSGVKLTYLPFIVKAVVLALRDVPIVNSTFDEQAGEVHVHDHYHIGIAVATAAGLIVPVIKDADKKDLLAIAGEIDRLTQQARQGRIHWHDLQGGTFTITSIGNIGGLMATPIINHPQVAIVGIGRIVKRPVYDEHDQLRPAQMLYLSFSFDHRVIDGAVGAVFGNAVRRYLQQPARLLLPTPSPR